MDADRVFLRHTVATLAYRAAKALRDAPPEFATFSVAAASRTPVEILAHMGDLFDWALEMARGRHVWHDSTPLPWDQEVERFFTALQAFDASLAATGPLEGPAQRLFQGPVADALTHTGQIAMLRRLAGSPVRAENLCQSRHRSGLNHALAAAAARRVRLTFERWTESACSGSFTPMKTCLACVAVVLLALLGAPPLAGQSASNERLIVYGDVTWFFGGGRPMNCALSSRFKRGEPVGFRMTAINSVTGERDRATQLVVHLTYGGKTIDVPMRDRQTATQPERTFFVAKWIVPDDAPIGVVRYTVTAKDSQGRTGEFKPFEVETSQITIVE